MQRVHGEKAIQGEDGLRDHAARRLAWAYLCNYDGMELGKERDGVEWQEFECT